jgi:hypothetical protein
MLEIASLLANVDTGSPEAPVHAIVVGRTAIQWLIDNLPALGTLIAALVVFFKQIQNSTLQTANAAKLQDVHVLVNSRFSEALTKIATLEARLSAIHPYDLEQAKIATAARVDAGGPLKMPIPPGGQVP